MHTKAMIKARHAINSMDKNKNNLCREPSLLRPRVQHFHDPRKPNSSARLEFFWSPDGLTLGRIPSVNLTVSESHYPNPPSSPHLDNRRSSLIQKYPENAGFNSFHWHNRGSCLGEAPSGVNCFISGWTLDLPRYSLKHFPHLYWSYLGMKESRK